VSKGLSAALVAGVLVCALGVVHVRQESRLLFVRLQALQAERDRLTTEWGRLLLEQGTWSAHARIEEVARVRLGMTMPQPDRILVIHTEHK
jgi:cell division protein FtsL